jgi:hypothetical protein
MLPGAGFRGNPAPGWSKPLCRPNQFGGMDRTEPLVPLEIPDIERQQLRDAVNIHACGQPGVMDLHALDLVRD